jgi:hypothetical protein
MTNPYRILVGNPGGKERLGRARRRWEDSIKMNVKETGWEGVYGVCHEPVVASYKHSNEHCDSLNGGYFLTS